MFSPPAFVSVGVEYDSKSSIPERFKGRSMLTKGPTTGKLNGATFGPFVSLSVGDKYVSAQAAERNRRSNAGMADDSGDVPHKVFRPTNPAHKPNGSGTYYGTFSEAAPPRHEPEYITGGATKSSKSTLPAIDGMGRVPRNFLTNPAKKGTYGYTGLTVAKAGEVVYVSDPYDNAAHLATIERRENAAKLHMGPPFRAAVRRTGCFDENERGFSTVYTLNQPLPAKSAVRDESASRTSVALESGLKPWKPAGTLQRSISKPPEYLEDPYDEKEQKLREEREKEREHKAWLPVRNDPWRHIYHKAIPYNPPPQQSY